MARSMALDVLVRLKDLLSSPLRRLTQGLRQLAQVGRSIGVIGTAIAAISFMAPIREAAAFQQKLIDIAATQNLVGKQAFGAVDTMKSQYEGLALEIGQLSDTVASGAGEMIAAGVDPKLIDVSIGRIGRAATAANAEFSDMSGVATSMLQSLQLPADQLDDSLAALVIAGKEGSFELKAMARYFPTLTSQMAKFGVTGREAVNFLGAALQIASKGTADPAEAANNLKNFLSKILAPATLKAFSKAGVDIEGVMRDAATKGINPIEAVMQKIVKLTGVSSGEIEKLMQKAKKNGLEGAEALGYVREQLEQIHGAGALGELFSDMQVMDFLIPFLTNVDEYKRIKGEVAKATGSMIDADFETQMQGLNRQLITFQEIGTQAWREVGFAFGKWLPAINENLMAALKWLRELDASTGGMVQQTIMWAGAGILAAAALGALALALPVIGAGLSLVMSLLSPVGLLLAGLALAGKHIYDNWGSYGPRLMQVWQRLKTGMGGMIAYGRDLAGRYGPMIAQKFGAAWGRVREGASSIAASIRAATPQVLAAGREMVDRYGPIIRDGLMTAWGDLKAGLTELQRFFDAFAKAANIKIDTSGWTIDAAKVAVFERLDTALKAIGIAWEAMKDFGSGFAVWLEPLGASAGRAVDNIVQIAEGSARLSSAMLQLVGLTDGRAGSIFKFFGDLAGGSLTMIVNLFEGLAEAIKLLVNGLAALIEAINRGIDWSKLLPDSVVGTWNALASAINAVKAAMDSLSGSNPGVSVPGTRIGKYDRPSNDNPGDATPAAPQEPQGAGRAGRYEQRSSISPPIGGSRLAAIQRPARQEVDFKGAITVAVDGPGKVTGATSTNKDVSIATGRRTGRV